MEGLCAAWPAQDHDLGCGGVHAALLTPRAAFRPGPHPPVRLSGQPLPHSKPATVPRAARCWPNSCTSRFPQPCRYQRPRSLVLSDLQARAVDHDRSHTPRTGYGPGHFMTLSRDPSSSSFDIPLRDSADLCLHLATQRVQVCSTASPAIRIVARISSHDSNCVVSGILSVVFIGKTPFKTQ